MGAPGLSGVESLKISQREGAQIFQNVVSGFLSEEREELGEEIEGEAGKAVPILPLRLLTSGGKSPTFLLWVGGA